MVFGRDEVLRLLADGTLRVDEAAVLLDRRRPDAIASLEIQHLASGQTLLRAVVPQAFVTAAAAAGLALALDVGKPALAIAWRDLAAAMQERGYAEACDEASGVVATLRVLAEARRP